LENLIVESGIKNHLGLFQKSGDPDVDATVEFLETSRKELAEAFGFTDQQLRPERLSGLAKDRIRQLAGALEFAAEAFNGDPVKTKFWIKTPNPNFGGASPRELIIRGRYKKVLQFILAARHNRTPTR
jgi:hypothetical protein